MIKELFSKFNMKAWIDKVREVYAEVKDDVDDVLYEVRFMDFSKRTISAALEAVVPIAIADVLLFMMGAPVIALIISNVIMFPVILIFNLYTSRDEEE